VVVMTVLIQQRIYDRSVRAIARTHGCSVTEVNAVIDRFADATIDEKTRKHSLALELARLDQLQETFCAQTPSQPTTFRVLPAFWSSHHK
jgi:hypothetical protein